MVNDITEGSKNDQRKIRLLILYELLLKNTDGDNPLTTPEIIEMLGEYGISVTRQTLYDDIRVLNDYGYEVLSDGGKVNKYYVVSRQFERPEIEILINAVKVANFLTESKKISLIGKIAELLGKPQGEQIKSTLAVRGESHGNKFIYYSINEINYAIAQRKKLSFRYYDYGNGVQRVYRKDGERYEVNPIGLIYSEDNLYLVCFHDKYGNPVHYRIDRMTDVKTEDKPITEREEYKSFNLDEYKKTLFSMYSGEEERVSLWYSEDCTDMVVDRFGEDICPNRGADGGYIISCTVNVNKTFFSWLTVFGGKIKILSPQNVRKQYKDFLQTLTENA